MDSSYQKHYASISDDELLHIAGDRRDLREDAVFALDAEMTMRGLTHEDARAKKRDQLRLEIKDVRAHSPKRKKSKYFVAQINLGAFILSLIGPVLLVFLFQGHHLVPEEWSFSIFVIYMGAILACLAVQPWVRRTLSFWLSLAISCVPQFMVSHWLSVYHLAHSRGDVKGSAFLSILAGYILGGALFVLLQKLKLGQGTKDAQ